MHQIGNYNITKKIEEGGMAIVYQGIQESLNRPVAIKVLKQQFTGDPLIVDYFNRESLIIARLIHPNIINVIDRGLTKEGMPYFIMEFIEGTNTARLIVKGGLKFDRKLDIIIQTCKALAYAHKNGVIHRDIKPANILIDTEGNARVADFGLAQFYQKGVGDREGKKEVLGTPSYMSPEQKKDSRSVTFASDIYSLGVVMYELFTGTRIGKKPKLPSELSPDIPKPLEKIILQCLSPTPERRPASVETIKNLLLMLFQGAHIGAARKKKVFNGVPKMDEIVAILDVIKENETGSVFLLRHKESEQLMVAKTFSALNEGIKTARVFLSLKHDNIINIQGVSGSGTNYIVVMEYLSGGSLEDRMVMPHAWQEALRIINDVCQGLFFAHNNRITHGNLRPSNILFTPTESAKLSDFRLGGSMVGGQLPARSHAELIQADVLAVGAIFYKMILGFPPELKGDGFLPHKQFKTLPDDIKRLIYRFLTQRADIRFQSMKQVIDEISRIQDAAYEVEETAISLDENLSDSPQKNLVKETAPETDSTSSSGCLIVLVFFLTIFSVLAGLYFFGPKDVQEVFQKLLDSIQPVFDLFRHKMKRLISTL